MVKHLKTSAPRLRRRHPRRPRPRPRTEIDLVLGLGGTPGGDDCPTTRRRIDRQPRPQVLDLLHPAQALGRLQQGRQARRADGGGRRRLPGQPRRQARGAGAPTLASCGRRARTAPTSLGGDRARDASPRTRGRVRASTVRRIARCRVAVRRRVGPMADLGLAAARSAAVGVAEAAAIVAAPCLARLLAPPCARGPVSPPTVPPRASPRARAGRGQGSRQAQSAIPGALSQAAGRGRRPAGEHRGAALVLATATTGHAADLAFERRVAA